MIFFPISKSTSQSEPFLVLPYFSSQYPVVCTTYVVHGQQPTTQEERKSGRIKKKTESDVILWVSSKIIKSWKHFGAVFGAVVIKADATHLSEKDKVILTDYPLPRGGKER